MAISIQCAQCGQTYKVRDDLAGKRVECKCGQALAVPQPSPDPEAGALPGQDPTAALLDDALPPTDEGAPLAGTVGADLAASSPQSVLPPLKEPANQGGPNPLLIGAIVGGSLLGVLLVGLVILLATRSGAASVTPDFSTPEGVFEMYKKAAAAKDWATEIRVWTPETQEKVVGDTAFAALMKAKSAPEIGDLLKRHGVDESTWKDEPTGATPDNDQGIVTRMQERRRRIVAAIRDKPAFYA